MALSLVGGAFVLRSFLHCEVERDRVTDWSRQVFSALELGPGCLVLGISGGPPLS